MMDNEAEAVSEPQSTGSDLHDDIASAMASVESDAAPEASTPAVAVEEASETSGQPRGPDGKFAKKAADEAGHGASAPEAGATPAGVATTPPVGQPVPEPVAAVKPPQSWKPAAREHWASLPPAVQAEIARREGETSKVLSETGEARKFRETFQQAVAPYEAMLRSEGSDPVQAVSSLLETARQLKSGSPQQKAAMVAQIVRGYNVPIDALDAQLAGQPYQGQQQQPMQDPRVDQLFAQMEQAKQQRVQQEAQQADEAVTTFGADKEFFDDVREDMADIIEIAEKRGQKMDLEVAYKRAIGMNEEISGIMRQREAAKAAATTKVATQRSKAAASSVRGSGPPAATPPGMGSLEDEVRAAWEQATS
jgi:hypothetical protein